MTAIAILAGGESRRMGQDKALLTIAGESLLARTVRIAAATGLPVYVVGRDSGETEMSGARFVTDTSPGLGPIGGLKTVLAMVDSDVLLLACDMPRITTDSLRWLLAQAATHFRADGLAVRNGEQIEPLFSLYTPACLPRIEAQIETRRRSLQSLIASGDFGTVEATPEIARALANVNTPQEWAAIQNEETTV